MGTFAQDLAGKSWDEVQAEMARDKEMRGDTAEAEDGWPSFLPSVTPPTFMDPLVQEVDEVRNTTLVCREMAQKITRMGMNPSALGLVGAWPLYGTPVG